MTATSPPTTGSSTRRSPPTSRGSTTRPAVPKEHDRCGSNLVTPMMLLSAGGTVLLERLVERPGPLVARRASASAAPLSRSRCSPGATATTAHRSPRPSTRLAERSSGWWRRRSRPPSSSQVGRRRPRRDPPRRGWLHCARPAARMRDVRTHRSHRSRRRGPRRRAGALREELRDGARAPRDGRVAGRRGGPARCRRRARRAAARRSGPTPRSASSSPARDRVFTTSPTRWTTSTRRCVRLADAGIELIDSEPRVGIRDSRVAFLHPRSTGGVLTEIVEPSEGGH